MTSKKTDIKLNDISIHVESGNQPLANTDSNQSSDVSADLDSDKKGPKKGPKEVNGPKGLEPTRYGDWEFKGRCSDF